MQTLQLWDISNGSDLRRRVGAGFDAPARGLYPRLCRDLMAKGISSLRIDCAIPLTSAKQPSIFWLEPIAWKAVALRRSGLWANSSGGAAVMQAAALSSTVRTVVTLASQSFGFEAVSKFRPGTSVLAIHGSEDEILSPLASEAIYKMAREPKKMVIYKGAGHVLDEASDEIFK
jgi:fermentation-respiration switch protein FrsA (DUF1100 family)